MKFVIERVSTNKSKSPHESAQRDDRLKEWFVEIDTFEQLMDLAEEYDLIVQSKYELSAESAEEYGGRILIYDDYIE